VDNLLEQASTEPDEVTRKADYIAFQEIIDKDLPVINLVAVDDIRLLAVSCG
jgi:ABC-type transport system substrate-binding protein